MHGSGPEVVRCHVGRGSQRGSQIAERARPVLSRAGWRVCMRSALFSSLKNVLRLLVSVRILGSFRRFRGWWLRRRDGSALRRLRSDLLVVRAG